MTDETIPAPKVPEPQMEFTEAPKKVARPTNAVISENPVSASDSDVEFETVLPSGHKSDADRIEQDILSSKLTGVADNEAGREWFGVIKAGGLVSPVKDAFRETVEDPEAFFEQTVTSSSGPLSPGASRFKSVANETLKGEKAVMRMMAHLGLGTMFRIPLWNSGFWITLKAPAETDILELQRIILSDKILLGRSSYGLIHSNITSYTVDRLLEFALSNLHQSSLETGKDIRNFISCHDIPTVIWGLACTIWPQGFKYQRACMADPEKCKHIVTEKLNLGKILWTNTKGLSDWQIAHMSSVTANSKKEEDVLRYQSESLKAQKRKITIAKGTDKEFFITLKIPNAESYIDSGHRWINEIVDVVNRAITQDSNYNEKNAYINKRAKATTLRQYGHWIDSIEFNENLIEDSESIESTLDVLSGNDNIRNELIDAITSYISNTTLTVVGIPSYNCPGCGEEQKAPTTLPNHTNIIPIDVYTTFFTLLVQKLEKIEKR